MPYLFPHSFTLICSTWAVAGFCSYATNHNQVKHAHQAIEVLCLRSPVETNSPSGWKGSCSAPAPVFKASRTYRATHLPGILARGHIPPKVHCPHLRKLFNSPTARGYAHGVQLRARRWRYVVMLWAIALESLRRGLTRGKRKETPESLLRAWVVFRCKGAF